MYNKDVVYATGNGDSYGSRGGDSYDSRHGDSSRGEKRRLPRQFNGVSDACLHVDAKGHTIFVFGCWMACSRDCNVNFRSDISTAAESCLGHLSLAPFHAAAMSFAVLGTRFCYSQMDCFGYTP